MARARAMRAPFEMHMCVGKRLAETVSKTRAQRQKWSGRIIFKLLARKRSFVRNGKYRGFFENNNYRRQIHVNFFFQYSNRFVILPVRVTGPD